MSRQSLVYPNTIWHHLVVLSFKLFPDQTGRKMDEAINSLYKKTDDHRVSEGRDGMHEASSGGTKVLGSSRSKL